MLYDDMFAVLWSLNLQAYEKPILNEVNAHVLYDRRGRRRNLY